MGLFATYASVLFFAWIVSILRWKLLSKADRWICLLLLLTIIQESIAYYLQVRFHNNYITYHIYTPIELAVICLYFDRSLKFKRPYRIGLIVAATALVISIINTAFYQPYDKINSYFLLIEGCVVIGFCLLSFYRIIIQDDTIPGKMVQFWITICFLFYWSLSYANLGLYGAQVNHTDTLSKIFTWSLYSANLLFYFGIALVFLRYKKLIPSGE